MKEHTMTRDKDTSDITKFLSQMHLNFGINAEVDAAAEKLITLARRAQRYNVLACNVVLTPRQSRNATRINDQATAIGASLNTAIYTNGDPRGYALAIRLPNGAYNTWGGVEHGWGIPTTKQH